MKGLDEFLTLFGDLTVSRIVIFVLAGMFLFSVYKEIKKYVNAKIKEQQDKTKKEDDYVKKINDAWEATQKYPEYRKQSLGIQKDLTDKINEIKDDESNIMLELKKISNRIEKMEDNMRERDKNKLRDLLIKYYNHYANKNLNPSQTWTEMEEHSFKALLKDYEEMGGNDYIHSTVKPAMDALIVVDMDGMRKL